MERCEKSDNYIDFDDLLSIFFMILSSIGFMWFYFIFAAEDNCTKNMSQSPNTKITLEEYLQAHKIQKKLEERNRSRSKGK